MNDDQFQLLIRTMHELIREIHVGHEKISSMIDSVYSPPPTMYGMERRLDKLIDAINDAAERI